jgi:hypothetical protein
MERTASGIALIVLLTLIGLRSGRAISPPPAATLEPYIPGLGDFMTAYIQPHHVKLWFAGIAGNWRLAAYEANELNETFDDVVTYQANWHDLPIGKLAETLIRPQITRVAAAIAAKDTRQFKNVYADLTVACNRCHRIAAHEFIEVIIPANNPYADQNLRSTNTQPQQ